MSLRNKAKQAYMKNSRADVERRKTVFDRNIEKIRTLCLNTLKSWGEPATADSFTVGAGSLCYGMGNYTLIATTDDVGNLVLFVAAAPVETILFTDTPYRKEPFTSLETLGEAFFKLEGGHDDSTRSRTTSNPQGF